MITCKTPQEIATIREGGRSLAQTLDDVLAAAVPGVTTNELDALAERLIIERGGVPAFKGYRESITETPFPGTICASINDELVHTPPSDRVLKVGDVLTVDIGMQYPAGAKGLFTDMARTISIGETKPTVAKLLQVTERSLELGIEAAKIGNHVSDISRAVQTYVENHGFSVVRQLVGHGVGYKVHEEPRVPNFVGSKGIDVLLQEGMVLAIEPMVNVGSYEVKTLDNGWTVATADGNLCAHFEHTIAITKTGPVVLTAL